MNSKHVASAKPRNEPLQPISNPKQTYERATSPKFLVRLVDEWNAWFVTELIQKLSRTLCCCCSLSKLHHQIPAGEQPLSDMRGHHKQGQTQHKVSTHCFFQFFTFVIRESSHVRGRSDKYLAYKRNTKIWKSDDLFLNTDSFSLDTLDPAMLQLL